MTPLAYGAAIALAIERAVEPEEVARLVAAHADARDGRARAGTWVGGAGAPTAGARGRGRAPIHEDGRAGREARAAERAEDWPALPARRARWAAGVMDGVVIAACVGLVVLAAMWLAWMWP